MNSICSTAIALIPLSGSALNAFAIHELVRPQVLAQFSPA